MPKKSGKSILEDSRLYEDKSINSLILFGIYRLHQKGELCSFERLLEECFKLSPKTFCLASHQEWPDSRKLDRPLRSLREEKVLYGNPKASFSLTSEGEKIAEQIAKSVRQGKLKI